MRCMTELNMSVRREAVHAYPRDLQVLVSVSNDFLDSWFFLCQLGVGEHAFSDRWNAGAFADVCADMTIDTLHPEFHVCAMRKCNGLLCRGGQRADDEE